MKLAKYSLILGVLAIWGLATKQPASLLSQPIVDLNRVSLKVGHNSYFVDVKVDGQGPFKFVLDTGAELTLFSPKLATALNMNPGKKRMLRSLGGNSEFREGTAKSIEILSAKAVDFPIGITEISSVGGDRDGVLGADVLRRFRAIIDLNNNTLTLCASD